MWAKFISRSLLVTALVALQHGMAHAASIYILESSPRNMGNAFSGTASSAEDASTNFFNAAGLTQLDRPTITVGGNIIIPDVDFRNTSSTAATGTALQAPLTGPNDGVDKPIPFPNFYYGLPVNKRISVGFGLNVPFGLESEYSDDWIGRYHATYSKLTAINFNPNIAFKITDKLSIGGGINYQWLDATLKNEVDSFGACVAARDTAGDPSPVANCSANPSLTGFANRADDSSIKIDGSDMGVGFNVGLLYKFDNDTRVGLSWREGVDYDLAGRVTFDRSAACNSSACAAALVDGSITASLELPDVVTLSATHGISDHWRLDADIAWYGWDSIQAININRPNGQNVATLDLQYENSMRYSLGTSYSGFRKLILRTGVLYDESPVPNAETLTPRIPDNDRIWFTVGASYSLTEDITIDMSYAHLFVNRSRINNTQQGHTLTGELDPTVDILSIGGSWRF